MMFVLRDLSRQPAAVAMVIVGVLVFVVLRTRLARWVIHAVPLLLWLCAEPGRFDGQPHITQKFDATTFVWITSVELRALCGLLVILLAAPIGATIGRLLPVRRGPLLGLAALGPYGLGLLTSSALLMRTFVAILNAPEDATAEKMILLRTAIGQSHAIVGAAAAVSIVVVIIVASRLAREPSVTTSA